MDSEWSLFDDEPVGAVDDGVVGGVPANEHPYFKKRLFPDESLKDALEDYVPTACDFLSGTLGRSTAVELQKAAEAFVADQLETCILHATRCTAAAWQLLQQSPTEAAVHAHALAHAMLAASIKDVYQAMVHADLSLSLCPDLPIPAVHSVMRKCNEGCQNAVGSGVEDAAWEISAVLPIAKTPQVRFPIRRLASSQVSMMDFREKWFKIQQPGIIEGHLATGWTIERWKDLRFWAQRHGHRTVPVEMGFCEGDEQSVALQQSDSQGSMLLSDFTKRLGASLVNNSFFFESFRILFLKINEDVYRNVWKILQSCAGSYCPPTPCCSKTVSLQHQKLLMNGLSRKWLIWPSISYCYKFQSFATTFLCHITVP